MDLDLPGQPESKPEADPGSKRGAGPTFVRDPSDAAWCATLRAALHAPPPPPQVPDVAQQLLDDLQAPRPRFTVRLDPFMPPELKSRIRTVKAYFKQIYTRDPKGYPRAVSLYVAAMRRWHTPPAEEPYGADHPVYLMSLEAWLDRELILLPGVIHLGVPPGRDIYSLPKTPRNGGRESAQAIDERCQRVAELKAEGRPWQEICTILATEHRAFPATWCKRYGVTTWGDALACGVPDPVIQRRLTADAKRGR